MELLLTCIDVHLKLCSHGFFTMSFLTVFPIIIDNAFVCAVYLPNRGPSGVLVRPRHVPCPFTLSRACVGHSTDASSFSIILMSQSSISMV